MPAPIRNIGQAEVGAITSTPAKILRRLGVKLTIVRGVVAGPRRRGRA